MAMPLPPVTGPVNVAAGPLGGAARVTDGVGGGADEWWLEEEHPAAAIATATRVAPTMTDRFADIRGF
jgi:hypothetical protein